MLLKIQGKLDQLWDVLNFIDFRDERSLYIILSDLISPRRKCGPKRQDDFVQGHTTSYMAELDLIAGLLTLFSLFFP